MPCTSAELGATAALRVLQLSWHLCSSGGPPKCHTCPSELLWIRVYKIDMPASRAHRAKPPGVSNHTIAHSIGDVPLLLRYSCGDSGESAGAPSSATW